MNIIVTLPVKNEEWVLPCTLKNFSSFADHIILADQKSSDKTVEVCKDFEKAKVIKNPFIGYTNEVRWLLLDEARKIPGENLILCLDADEQISPEVIEEIKKCITSKDSEISLGFSSKWLQVYGSQKTYRTDYPWDNNYKPFAFLDDRKIDYDRSSITNEHMSRIPETNKIIGLNLPIIHLQWLARRRSEIKQVVYMCTELMDGWDPKKTNNRYSVAKFLDNVPLAKLEDSWLKEVYFPSEENLNTYDEVKFQDINKMFDKKGTLFFEPLDIWHVPEFKNRFKKENGRLPTKIKVFPSWLIYLNNIKNRIKYNNKLYQFKIKFLAMFKK